MLLQTSDIASAGTSSYVQRTNQSFFTTTPADSLKMGWYTGSACSTLYQYICERPAWLYTCPNTPPVAAPGPSGPSCEHPSC